MCGRRLVPGKAHTCGAGMGCPHVNGHNLLQTFVLQEAVEAGCVTEMLGVQDIQHLCANCNICGIFGADFRGMGALGRKAGTTTCRCPWTSWLQW